MTTLPRSENFLHIRQVRIEKTVFFFLDKEAGIAMMQRDTRERIKAVLSVFAGFVLLAIRCRMTTDGKAPGAGVSHHSFRIPLHANQLSGCFSRTPGAGACGSLFFRTLDP